MTEGEEIIFGSSSSAEVKCLCVTPSNPETAIICMQHVLESELIPEFVSCQLNNVTRCCNTIITEQLKYYNPVRLAFTDLFYRLRHELLFKALCLVLKIKQSMSDKPFNQFGIDSNRTPDYIGYHNDFLCIIEVTATSSYEKGAQNKGLEEAGFESKYKKEVNMAIEQGIPVKYIPFIFEMSTLESKEYNYALYESEDCFPGCGSNSSILEFVAKEMKIITMNLKEHLTAPSSLIFSKPIHVEKDHESIEFIYREMQDDEGEIPYPRYMEYKLSTKVYTKIINSWDSIGYKIRRLDEDLKYKFIIDMVTNRTYFEERKLGVSKLQWYTWYDTVNKHQIFKNTLLNFNGDYKDCLGSETGFTYIIASDVTIKEQGVAKLLQLKEIGHDSTTVDYTGFDFQKYIEMHDMHSNKPIYPNFYNPSYDKLYSKMLTDLDGRSQRENGDYRVNQEPSFLGENRIKEYDINKVMKDLIIKHLEANSFNDTLPLKKRKMKTPFILPLSSMNQTHYITHKFKNVPFIRKCINEMSNKNLFTKIILEKTLNEDYRFGEESNQPSQYLNGLVTKRSEINREMTYLYKQILKTSGQITSKVEKLPDSDLKFSYLSLRNELPGLNKIINDQYKQEGIKRNISMIRLKTKSIKKTKDKPHTSENFLTALYKQEMLHFKDRTVQSTIEGVGVRVSVQNDYNIEKNLIREITELLPQNCGYNPDILIDTRVQEDCRLLKECKEFSMNEFKNIIEEIRSSYLGHASAFVSRFAHSLLFYSQLPFNSDYVRIDNLGYKDVLLIVKGGKKIFKTKSSKLYRLIYPVSNQVLKLHINPSYGTSSFEFFTINDQNYLVTPWMLLHESILNDALSFYSRVTSFAILNSNPKLPYSKQYSLTATNILLAFHNRRQTESLLANLRYILLSTIGEYSAFSGILKEFIGFNYDLFQSYIRNSILTNYPEYFRLICNMNQDKKKNKDIKSYNIKNIFNGKQIWEVDELALMIYSTFLMTKAPYQRSVERANNLKGILEIHEDFDLKVGLKLNPEEQFNSLAVKLSEDSTSYISGLFENDYKFDPEFVTQVGVFADSYFKNRGLEERIFTCWSRILNENWDSMATSTGLRGRINDVENFWGKKGYFVIYKEIVNDEVYMSLVDKLINDGNLEDDDKRKMLRQANQTYFDKMKSPANMLLFHAVDKTQWRGGREIYVMDMDTKVAQQPIEKFMGELCKMTDNELISIPSDRRAQTIHHSIFEKDLPLKEAITYYLTLDCSKWAPKSIFIKFCLLIAPMSVIPASFKKHFFNYICKLYYKRIYFNQSEVVVLANNPKYKAAVEQYLIKDEKLGGYYMLMPYSWVMGIFNYTSSFLHAFNQKYISYLITQTSLDNFQEETTMVMFAHSDDSGGRISSTNEKLIQRGLIIYEIGLKACNHLLSRKKSTVSKVYFEILSVIYLFKKLLALLPKFLGGIRFLPTDKGMAQDMLQSYSKSIEVMVAGADFSIAYLVEKIYSMLVWKFYNNTIPSQYDYERPVQFLGMPDAHPLTILISGSDSDIIRILYNKGEDYLTTLTALASNVFDTYNDEGPIRSIKFRIQIRNAVRGFETQIAKFDNVLTDWSIKNINFKTTPFSLLNFLSKLNDPGFVGSLMNESPIRRISRSYFLRIGLSVITKYGPKSLKFTMDTLNAFCAVANNDYTLKTLLEETLPFEDMKQFTEQISELKLKTKNNINVLKMASYNILKIYKYFSQITLDGKDMLNTNRTLKPTHLEIIKTNKAFSVDFNPSQLVSFTKGSSFKWALPNVNNLINAEAELDKLLMIHNFDKSNIDESTLLKLLNMFTGKSVKEIYLYSHVPSEIRSMRTYSSLLSFLSVNTRKGKEISGLVLKLQADLTDPGYLPLQIDENVYLLNTFLISLLTMSKIYSWAFVSKLNVRENGVLETKTALVPDFIQEIKIKYNENYYFPYLSPIINYIESRLNWPNRTPTGSIFKGGCFYTFTKSQKLSSGWYGRGEILIIIQNSFYKFELTNDLITSCITNFEGKLEKAHQDYITDVLTSNDLYLNPKVMKNNYEVSTENSFGFDHSGDLRVGHKREIKSGINCYYKTSPGGDIAHIDRFNVDHLDDNAFSLKIRSDESKPGFKVRTIKILKGELLNTLRMMLDERDFTKKLTEEGIESFDEFLLTEVLTHFGGENYVKFEDLIDNCQSSKLYEVMKWEQENDILPDDLPRFGCMPGSVGSFAYSFLKYGEVTNDWIIKQPKALNRALMNIRSEHPENFTVILNEEINKSFTKIYDVEDRAEIRSAYMELISMENPENIQSKLIELMCYWGYASLVNSIQCFSGFKKHENYKVFKISGFDLKEEQKYAELFVVLLREVNKSAMKFNHLYRELNYPIKKLSPGKGGIEEVLANYIKGVTASLYKLDYLMCSHELYTFKFLNLLVALFKEPEFLEDMNESFSKLYPFSLIPINESSVYDFIITHNTLKAIWYRVNNVNYELNFTKMVELFPPNVPNPFKFYNNFGINFTPADTYFHGLMSREFLAKVNNRTENFTYKGVEYLLKNELGHYSKIKVPIFKEIPMPRPLNPEVFDHENWEEIICESEMVEIDNETVEEYWNEIEDQFSEVESIIEENFVEAKVTWVLDLGCENRSYKQSYIRQIGEFIILLTTRVGSMKEFVNCHAREIYIKGPSKHKINLMAYVLLPEEVDPVIVDKMFGKNTINIDSNTVDVLKPLKLRTPDGNTESTQMGKLFEDMCFEENVTTTEEEEKEEDPNTKLKQQISEMESIVNEAIENNPTLENVFNNLLKKYKSQIGSSIKLTNELLIESLLAEINLNELNSKVTEVGSLDLSKEQIISIFLSPTHFGITKNTTLSKPVDFKNKKVKAELESFEQTLGDKVGSGTLTISPKYRRIMESNLDIWKVYVNNTSYRQESKKFLWNVVNKLCVDASSTETDEDDDIWKELVEKCVNILAEKDKDAAPEGRKPFKLTLRQGARLKYYHKGV